jgi:23S rRNA (pseudouridine1915-N3)-methyltransferase
MRLVLAAVGKLRPAYREACDDYLTRLARYADMAEHEVREAARAPTPEKQRAQEAAALWEKLPSGGTLVVLDRTGQAWSSEDLARRMDEWRLAARPVSFVIGGSTGLDDAFVRKAQARWSLGALTLPHELARVVVAEQLYRAWTILRGEPYHK